MGELVVIDNEQIALPEARHELARKVSKHIPRVIRVLPSDADRVQFAIALMIACNEVDPNKVGKGHEDTLLSSALAAVRMNLMPGGEMGLCYFVPFKGQVQCIPGYRGYIHLATSNSYLRWLSTEVVYANEEFRHWHDERGHHVTHEIPLDRADNDREIVGAYCSYQTRAGDAAVPVVINRKIIDAARKTNSYDAVWSKHFAEMAMKTAIRRASKRWKLTPQLAKAVYFDELAERGEPQPLELPDGLEPEASPRKRLADLSESHSESFERLKAAIEAGGERADFYADIAAALGDTDISDVEAAELRGMLA